MDRADGKKNNPELHLPPIFEYTGPADPQD